MSPLCHRILQLFVKGNENVPLHRRPQIMSGTLFSNQSKTQSLIPVDQKIVTK